MKKIIGLLTVCILLMGMSVSFTKNKNDEITIYTSQESEDIDYLLKDFKEKYPDIKLNVIKGSTGDITAKLLLEKSNPQADFIWNLDVASVLRIENEGILASYDVPGLSNIDSTFYDSKNSTPKWVGTTIETVVMIVNEKEAEKKGIPIPTSFEDLTNPVYKGEIVMPDPLSSGTGYLAVNSWLQTKGEEVGWKYIDKVHDNVKYFTISGSAPSKSTGIGENVIGITYDKASIRIANDVLEVKTIYPSEGLPWTVNACALLNKKEIKDAAKTFYEWAISEDTMKLYGDIRLLTSFKNSKPSNEVPSNFREMLGKNDVYWGAENKSRICEEWKERFNK